MHQMISTQLQRKHIMKKYISYTMLALLATLAICNAAIHRGDNDGEGERGLAGV
jgi:hypothetical protein